MIEPVDPRLDDAILAEPTAIEPRRVLADFLEGHGHPRAELIRLYIAGKDTKDWFARHANLAGLLARGVGSEWRLGYCDELTLTNVYDVPIETLWSTIATHRSYRFLRELTLVRTLRFDPALPPPDGIRTLRIYYAVDTLRSLASVQLPRLTTLIVDQHMKHPSLDASLLADALVALPALEELEVVKCLGEASANALVARLVRSPVRDRLRRLTLDRFPEAAARSLIDAGLKIALETEHETVATKTREQLRRTVLSWKLGHAYEPANRWTRSPELAPARYAAMQPVEQIEDQQGWVTVWAGSGVPLYEHPGGAHGGADCASCHGTNTLVIWARSEHQSSYSGWGPDSRVIRYELLCRDCERFTVHDGDVH